MSIRIPLAGLMLASFAACSQAPAPSGNSTETTERAAATRQMQPEDVPTTSETAGNQGDCDLLASSEIADAFSGKLSVERAGGRGQRGSGCTYALAEVSEAQLILQAGDRNAFEQRKLSYTSQSGIAREALDLGQEAWLFNGAQVIAVSEDGDSISLGLQLFTFDQPAPVDAAQTREALENLARTALARL